MLFTNCLFRLLDDNCLVLQFLGNLVPYEIAVGMNGKVWVNAASKNHVILISNAIINSENMNDNQVQAMVTKLAPHFQTS